MSKHDVNMPIGYPMPKVGYNEYVCTVGQLSTETVEGTARALEGIDYIERCNGFTI